MRAPADAEIAVLKRRNVKGGRKAALFSIRSATSAQMAAPSVGAFKIRGGLVYFHHLANSDAKPSGVISATRGNAA
jgi:hypothetical protein